LSACDGCIRRSALLGFLVPFIERSLDERRKLPDLLSLADEDLVAAVCGGRRGEADRMLERFDGASAREAATSAGMHACCRHDPSFPFSRLGGSDAPRLVYLRGDAGMLERVRDEPAVAVVGSRRASAYGLEVARSIGRELAACGVVVVSGMALGVDSAAHEGALDGGGPSLAVLAGGADVPYPRTKLSLYRRLCREGVVLSELPPGCRPRRWCFPARNRIMAALAEMTVVVEGRADSGSLITAGFAADLGREVGAVPGQVTSPLASGPNALLADGACVVRSASDVLDALYGAGAGERMRGAASADRRERLEPRLAAVLAAVEAGPGTVDAIVGSAAASGVSTGEALAALGELELLGLVRRTSAGAYIRCASA
jgi:DNA processing protein